MHANMQHNGIGHSNTLLPGTNFYLSYCFITVKSKGKLWESVLFCRIGPGDKSEAIRLGSKCLYWLSYLASPGLKLLILLKAEIYIGPGHCFIHSESTMPATELVLSLIG